MTQENPVGLCGIEFVEYGGKKFSDFGELFEKFGFKKMATHKTQRIELYRQGDINFLINNEPDSFAEKFGQMHGPSICSMGWRVKNASLAFEVAVQRGAKPYQGNAKKVSEAPAIYGIGDSLIYFIDQFGSTQNIYESSYNFLSKEREHQGYGYRLVDHLTNNVPKGEMGKWCDFYEKVFNFKEKRHFDIRGAKTGLQSKVMQSSDKKICIPINEPTENKSQIQEYLDEYKGSGIQHLALLTNDICSSIEMTRNNGVRFLETPDTYFETINDRVPNVTEKNSRLKELRILVDGDDAGYLLQIFTENLIGPIFFEVIQRKNHDGFGEGNFQALFDAIERDQEKRGVI